MKNWYEIKNTSNSVMDVDGEGRKVKVAISEMGSVDFDGDIIDHGAYTKTLSERGPKGANLIWHLTDHNPSLKTAIGKFSELYVDNNQLVGITNVPNTTWGNDVLEFYKSGHINQHSIGFRTIKNEQQKHEGADINLIKEVLLYEGSAVLWGANINTPTLEVGKALSKEEATSEIVKINDEVAMLIKSLRDGRFTDSAFEMIEMRLSQLQERIKNLTHVITLPEAVSVEPKSDESIDTISNILTSLTWKKN